MLLALASILTLTAAAPTLQRIIGGELVNSNNTGGTPYEFMTFLEISVGPNRVGYCGASLISSNMIVTAAHCLADITPHNAKRIITLESGVTRVDKTGNGQPLSARGGVSWTVIDYLVHPNYNSANISNDIAVIYVKINQNFLGNGQALPKPIRVERTDKINSVYTAIGFGKTEVAATGGSTNQLLSVQLKDVSSSNCSSSYPVDEGNPQITDGNVCAGDLVGKSTCNGDSGGPLFTTSVDGTQTLVGLTSWGIQTCNVEGPINYPSVFTRLSTYSTFLANQQIIADKLTGVAGTNASSSQNTTAAANTTSTQPSKPPAGRKVPVTAIKKLTDSISKAFKYLDTALSLLSGSTDSLTSTSNTTSTSTSNTTSTSTSNTTSSSTSILSPTLTITSISSDIVETVATQAITE